MSSPVFSLGDAPRNDEAPELRQQSEAPNETTPANHIRPQYPAHGTQAARLLAVALAGEKVHPLHGWKRLGIYRLSDTAFRLRGMGWPIRTDRLDVENRFGEPCHVALYGLPQHVIDEAGEAGQAFARHEHELMTRRAA